MLPFRYDEIANTVSPMIAFISGSSPATSDPPRGPTVDAIVATPDVTISKSSASRRRASSWLDRSGYIADRSSWPDVEGSSGVSGELSHRAHSLAHQSGSGVLGKTGPDAIPPPSLPCHRLVHAWGVADPSPTALRWKVPQRRP